MSPEPHTIRLRGPWQLEPIRRYVLQPDGTYLRTADGLPPAARAKMPADWSTVFGGDFLGRVCYRRTFQKPTGLDEGQRVWLVIEPPRSQGSIKLGEALLGVIHLGDPAGRFDITDRLESHNLLEIVVDHPALDEMKSTVGDPADLQPGGLVGEVRLEIEE